MLHQLEQIIRDRYHNPTDTSYTSKLFSKGMSKLTQKVGEEATEVIVAALSETRDDQIDELCDLFYHTLVLMRALDINLSDVEYRLQERHHHR